MTEELKDKLNEINVRVAKLESDTTHHSGRISDVWARSSDLEQKLDTLRERVDSNTKEILSALGDTTRSVANLRGWILGISASVGALFATIEFMIRIGLIG